MARSHVNPEIMANLAISMYEQEDLKTLEYLSV